MTMAELCHHFEQQELTKDDHWRSYSTKRNYLFYLRRWIIPRWGQYELGEVRTIEAESWLRSLPRARSTCAKIRNVMSILFNHSMRSLMEWLDDAKRNHRRNLYQPIVSLLMCWHNGDKMVPIRHRMTGCLQASITAVESLMGPSDSASVYATGSPRTWYPKALWLAHVSAYLFNPSAKRRNRVQGDAGTHVALVVEIHDGHLHAGRYASQARGPSRCVVLAVSIRDAGEVPVAKESGRNWSQ
jgi:hypothetical protein